MQKNCKQCAQTFEISEEDLKFYDKVSPVFAGKKYAIPTPTLCPDCRQQRRAAFRNERKLYHRKCDLTGKQIISLYSPDKPFKVFNQRDWWSDQWDATSHGRDFDFQKPFFQQFQELGLEVPHISIMNDDGIQSENCAYCHDFTFGKNCYLNSTVWHAEDCYYLAGGNYTKDVVDSMFIGKSELIYESMNLENCYNCIYLQNSTNCRDCFLGIDLQGCSDCFGSVGLRNKQYYIFNKPYSAEKYKEKLHSFETYKRSSLQKIIVEFRQFSLGFPRKATYMTNCEDSIGDDLYNCKDVKDSFGIFKGEHCRYYFGHADTVKNSYDILIGGEQEWCYECMVPDNSYMEAFCTWCWKSHNILYSDNCHNCADCFGCVGLRNKQYCILNRQYTKESYEELVPQIIEYMQKTGEWGEFFPVQLSPFAYNETIAQDYYPLEKTEVLQKGWFWKDDVDKGFYNGPVNAVPDSLQEVDAEVCHKIFTCEVTGKQYKITPQELNFYKKMNLPLPARCPDQRYKDRMSLGSSRKLWSRKCDKCGMQIQTTYAPERPEKVYCESCYLKEVY